MTEYDPEADLARRHPAFSIEHAPIAPLHAAVTPTVRIVWIDPRLTRSQRRTALAHEIAHLDLGHRPSGIAHFDDRQEVEADRLGARRLITVEALADAIAWCYCDREIAHHLDVEPDAVIARRADLTPDEVQLIEDRIAAIEHAA